MGGSAHTSGEGSQRYMIINDSTYYNFSLLMDTRARFVRSPDKRRRLAQMCIIDYEPRADTFPAIAGCAQFSRSLIALYISREVEKTKVFFYLGYHLRRLIGSSRTNSATGAATFP